MAPAVFLRRVDDRAGFSNGAEVRARLTREGQPKFLLLLAKCLAHRNPHSGLSLVHLGAKSVWHTARVGEISFIGQPPRP